MPAVSKSQQRLMQAAEHGADFPVAKKIRKSMSHDQMHDFAVGSEKGKPEHVAHHSPPDSYPTEVLKGSDAGIVDTNRNTFKSHGMSELSATKKAMSTAKKHPNRHLNLGKFLHPKKTK